MKATATRRTPDGQPTQWISPTRHFRLCLNASTADCDAALAAIPAEVEKLSEAYRLTVLEFEYTAWSQDASLTRSTRRAILSAIREEIQDLRLTLELASDRAARYARALRAYLAPLELERLEVPAQEPAPIHAPYGTTAYAPVWWSEVIEA